MTIVSGGTERTPVGRAVRLFEFLARSQQLKAKPPRTLDTYESVLWFGDLPEHPAITAVHREVDPEPGQDLLVMARVPHRPAPEPGELRPWLDGEFDNPDEGPRLREPVDEEDDPVPPEVRDAFDLWRAKWSRWAEQERVDRPARAAYNRLFSTYVSSTGCSEELEFVVAVGCLAWAPDGHEVVKRHLVTAPAVVHFDDKTGGLTVGQAEGGTVELDMLDPGLVPNSQHISQARDLVRLLEAPLPQRDGAGALAQRLVHALDGNGTYLDEDAPPQPGPHAVASFAPALILRKRSKQGMVDILDTIAGRLAESDAVSDGLLPLIDPDHRPAAAGTTGSGALVQVDDEPFLPMPVNEVQLRILKKVDTSAQTLVQGPPGTGKTHTAAALLCHLLAQGKRVLVTAHTDRALREVRAKLPRSIAPLAVSVIGTSRSDMSDLKVAVEQISHMAGEYDPEVARQDIEGHLAAIDRLRRDRASLHRRLVDARAHEVAEHVVHGYRGTLAAIAQRVEADHERHGWLIGLVDVAVDSKPPIGAGEMVEWHNHLLDGALRADEEDARLRRLPPDAVPGPDDFAALVAAERAAVSAEAGFADLIGHPAFDAMRRLGEAARTGVRQRLDALASEAEDLSRRREDWMDDALSDVRTGRAAIWRSRAQQISELVARATPLVDRLGPLTEVAAAGELGQLIALATALRAHVGDGGRLKTNLDGSPKTGAFSPKVVKQAQALFERARVDGMPPTTAEQLDAFLTWAAATRSRDALDKAWPESARIPAEDTLRERLQWHTTELAQLVRVLELGAALEAEQRRFVGLGLPRPDWHDLHAVQTYARVVDAAAATDARAAATAPLTRLQEVVDEVARWSDAAPCVGALRKSVGDRDHELYAASHRRLLRLVEVHHAVRRRDEIASSVRESAPGVLAAVERDPGARKWADLLPEWEQAWAWAATRAWVAGQAREDVNNLQTLVTATEERIRDQVERLAAVRAWGHAVSPQRLSGQARANLQQYAQLVKRLGKATGKYAAQRRVEVRAAMDRCRPAVPVWIMPIYRIAEQLRVQPDMFDVVVVDEASQAGLEATFLQYLAPKIVVIGDDKQVSPSAVGTDQQKLRDLADQYLRDDPYRASWQDPKRSLFDEAKMRFEGLLTLTEHRRCVPEIIGFSNRIAYEPDGIRLIPVRQYGADRLEPIKAVFLPDGYERGATDKVNPVEADAIVDQVEKCIADPRYDGLTFGVVSLLGGAQAKLVEKKLLERLPPEEWTARDLRCGDSADFQGSERDVMFLSMVRAPEPGKRIGALTQDLYVQRYNVAASRAKDQMWVFHSVRLSDLGNPEDMRFQLLDYCYGVINRAEGEQGTAFGMVPEDEKVAPFDSLFEQRVFNRLVDRGYTVIPQYPSQGYRLDLVVVGGETKLAIECDGDHWHGPEAYEKDLARQRDLERCGWRFFRIRESEFYADRPAVLDRLWKILHELDIHPSGWKPGEDDPVVVRPQPSPPAPAVIAAPEPVHMAAVPKEPVTRPPVARRLHQGLRRPSGRG